MLKEKFQDLFKRGKKVYRDNEDKIDELEEKAQELAVEAEKFAQETREDAEQLKEELSDASRARLAELSEKFDDASRMIKEKSKMLRDKAREIGKDEAAGKYLTTNILSRNDEIVAKRGEMITYELLRRAESEGKLDQVLRHASKNPVS